MIAVAIILAVWFGLNIAFVVLILGGHHLRRAVRRVRAMRPIRITDAEIERLYERRDS